MERLLFLGLSVFWLGQTLLTFSRGGLANLLIAVLVALPMLVSKKGGTQRAVLLGLIFVAITGWLVFPRLNSFTGGMLQTRLEDLDVSTRNELMNADLVIWGENLVFGVGPGASNIYRAPLFYGIISAAHTEYSRMLAEHGMFGLVSLAIMMGLAIHKTLSTNDRMAKGVTMALFAWAFIEMAHSAMRISATPFLYCLAFGVFSDPPSNYDESVSSLGKS
jgi:hypothetical protein